MSFEKVAQEMAAADHQQQADRTRREAARPRLARIDSLIADLEEQVAQHAETVPPPLLARARSYLENARIATGQSFPPRRRPGLVLDQVFEAASLMYHGSDEGEEGVDTRSLAGK